MGLQRAGIGAVVYEAHTPTSEEVGSLLTVATNGIDALRTIGTDTPVLAAAFPTHRPAVERHRPAAGAASNGGVLPDGTSAHTAKRVRLYRTLYQQAAGRGIRVEVGKRLGLRSLYRWHR